MSGQKAKRINGQQVAPTAQQQTVSARKKRKRLFVKELLKAPSMVVFSEDQILMYGFKTVEDRDTFLMDQVFDWDYYNKTFQGILSGDILAEDISNKELISFLYEDEKYVVFPGENRISYFEMKNVDLLWFVLRRVYNLDGMNARFRMIRNFLLSGQAKQVVEERDDVDDLFDILDQKEDVEENEAIVESKNDENFQERVKQLEKQLEDMKKEQKDG